MTEPLTKTHSPFRSNDERHVNARSLYRHTNRWIRKKVLSGKRSGDKDNLLRTSYDQLKLIDSQLADVSERAQAFKLLRSVGLTDFGCALAVLPHPDFPNLSRLLPRMAKDQIQRSFTGSSGKHLLTQSIDFVRVAAHGFATHSPVKIENAKMLDFGCGYGRLARLMYYFVNEENFYGVDPWSEVIDICHADGLETNFSVSDYLPESLPVGDNKFDLIYAFSVFTHLSPRATLTSLKTMARYLSDDGLILITIRPKEFWKNARAKRDFGEDAVEKHLHNHLQEGIAFAPHNRVPIDGDITYGDTSMTLDWLKEHAPFLEVVSTDISLSDQLQRYVFLKRVLD